MEETIVEANIGEGHIGEEHIVEGPTLVGHTVEIFIIGTSSRGTRVGVPLLHENSAMLIR